MKDILLDENNDIKLSNGDFNTRESEMQEVALILQSVQGEWKETPVLGPNLYRIHSVFSPSSQFAPVTGGTILPCTS